MPADNRRYPNEYLALTSQTVNPYQPAENSPDQVEPQPVGWARTFAIAFMAGAVPIFVVPLAFRVIFPDSDESELLTSAIGILSYVINHPREFVALPIFVGCITGMGGLVSRTIWHRDSG